MVFGRYRVCVSWILLYHNVFLVGLFFVLFSSFLRHLTSSHFLVWV
mgnify:CR=1 FL=1